MEDLSILKKYSKRCFPCRIPSRILKGRVASFELPSLVPPFDGNPKVMHFLIFSLPCLPSAMGLIIFAPCRKILRRFLDEKHCVSLKY